MEIVCCPTCGNPGGAPHGHEVPGFYARAGQTEFFQEPYSVTECEACGILYKNRTLAPDEFAAYYARKDFANWEIPGFHPPERVVLRRLRTLRPGGKILDFGCSSGRLLSTLVNAYQCVGCEVNEAARLEARKKGIAVLSPEELSALPGGYFDGIVLADVFEHIHASADLMEMLSRLLKPGGNLILITGNGDAAACRLDPAQFWYFRIIEHVAMMTRRHAAWLQTRLNLKLTMWQELPHYDLNYRLAARQSLQHFAYWQFRRGSTPVRALLRRLPGIRKAENWAVAPAFCYSADHVVLAFSK